MPDKNQIVSDLKRILTQDLFVAIPESEIKLNDSLADDLGIDSVGFVELVTLVEEKYGVEIDSREANSESLRTLDGLSGFILARIKERGHRPEAQESHA
jgi:acyl carrier protein